MATVKPTGEEKITITLPKLRDGQNDDVYVSVNAKSYLIKRGVPVTVPVSVQNALMMSDAAMDIAEAHAEKLSK